MKRLLLILLFLLISIPILMSLIVIINFFYIAVLNYETFLDKTSLSDFGLIGDFFSGHINGFILLTLIISLYFQRTSILQTWKSIKQQAEANKTISQDLQNSIKANMLLTKEFITTNYKNEFNEELNYIKLLMNKMEIQKLCTNDFKIVHILDSGSLIDLLKRKHYLNSLLTLIDDEDLRKSLIHKIDTANINIYIHKNEELLKRVFIFNELFKIFRNYEYYLLFNKQIKDIDEAKDLKNIYEFIINTVDKKLLMTQNRFELFENIASSNTLFEIDFNINFNTQLLWEIIFQKEFYILNNYYNIIIQDYELTI